MKDFNELLKKAREEGLVKNLEDAFDEFTSYEGIDYFVAEPIEIYGGRCKVGDIIYVRKYRYDDGRIGRNHMFVIIGQNNDEIFGMLISSDLDKLKYKENVLLEKNTLNNLQKNSIVKTDVIYKLLDKNIVFKIGEVEQGEIEEYLNKLKDNN